MVRLLLRLRNAARRCKPSSAMVARKRVSLLRRKASALRIALIHRSRGDAINAHETTRASEKARLREHRRGRPLRRARVSERKR